MSLIHSRMLPKKSDDTALKPTQSPTHPHFFKPINTQHIAINTQQQNKGGDPYQPIRPYGQQGSCPSRHGRLHGDGQIG